MAQTFGQGLAGLGAGIGAWGQVYKRRQTEGELEELWKGVLAEPTDPNQPDTFAGLRQAFKGASPKTLARVLGSDAFTPQGLKALASMGGKGGAGSNLIAGESIQAGFPNANLRGYIFKQNDEGEWSTLVSPQRDYALSPGQYLLDAGTNEVKAQVPERLQLANISQGGQLRLVDPNSGNSYVLAERAPAPSGGGGGGGEGGSTTPNTILPVPGVGPSGESLMQYYEYERGKGGAPGRMVQPITVGEKARQPVTREQEAAIALEQAKNALKTLRSVKLDVATQAAGKLGVVPGPEGQKAASAHSAALFAVAKLAGQGALQAPDKAVAEEMLGAVFAPIVTSKGRKAKLDEFERWLDATTRANLAVASGRTPTVIPAVPGTPAATAPVTGTPSQKGPAQAVPSIDQLLQKYGTKP